ncbi:unnamed protein product [Wuchereria bancrofti]|uniref:Uncharacterized protein n=1 Tax=Wuchereria bancrofti TaxID=6293 RepID=A0A3P7DBN3_WUCBA|nr:unnamed protein product [Wuchereria bancrofti]
MMVIFVVQVLSLGRTVVFGGQYHFFFEGHSKCMMKMKCGDKTAPVDIAVAICPGSNQISVAFGKKMHSPRYTSLFNIVRKEVHPQRGQLTGVSHFVLLSKPTQNDVKPASFSAIQ